jgi:hypothetical protein
MEGTAMEDSPAGGAGNSALHTLISLEDFKAILGTDDREDALSRHCLTTATYAIEQHCRRRLFLKRHVERIETNGDLPSSPRDDVRFTSSLTRRNEGLLLPLGEYPVREVLALHALCHAGEPEPVEPGLYSLWPEGETEGEYWPGPDIPHSLRLSPALGGCRA